MRQDNPLNRSRTPARRPQVQPGPTVVASGASLGAVADSITALTAVVEAMQLVIDDHEARIAALEAQGADHESRITALEP